MSLESGNVDAYDIDYISNETYKRTIWINLLVTVFGSIILFILVISLFPEIFDINYEDSNIMRRKNNYSSVPRVILATALFWLLLSLMTKYYNYKPGTISFDNEKITIGEDQFSHSNILYFRMFVNRKRIVEYITLDIIAKDNPMYRVRIKKSGKLLVFENAIINSGIFNDRGFQSKRFPGANGGIMYIKAEKDEMFM